MTYLKKLNIWNTDFRVIVSKNIINKIKQKILNNGGPKELYNITKITPTVYYRILNGKGSSIKSYKKIINFLKINKYKAEKEIIGLTYNGGKFIYPYIKELNPLLFRIICHIIGDGNVASKNTSRWIQHKSNSHWLSELIKAELGFFPTKTKNNNCDMVTISAYFSKLAKYILDININSIKDYKTIRKFLDLPKEYKIQFIEAFIVDEGHIRYKKGRSCIISQNNKKFLSFVSYILDSLEYKHSRITKEIDKNGFVIYRMNIYIEGMLKFHKDISTLVNKYGKYAGLWQKQEELENYIKTFNINNIKYSKTEKDKINLIIYDLAKRGSISYKLLKENPILKEELKKRNSNYLINKFYELNKKAKFTRISNGVYNICK